MIEISTRKKHFYRYFLLFAVLISEVSLTLAQKFSDNHHKTSLIPNPSSLENSYEDEYEAFEADHFNSIAETSKRTKRFIYLNSDTNVAVALLIGVPLTLTLPSMSNIFNKWRKRQSRSIKEDENYNFEDDPTLQSQLDRISTYFELVDIPEHQCQLRAVCEFSAEPEKYYPLSEMILGRIRNPQLPAMVYFENDKRHRSGQKSKSENITISEKPSSLFKIYNEAADSGLTLGSNECAKEFGNGCQYSMDKLLNMPTLRFWTAMQSFLRLNFKDGDSDV